MMDMKKQYLGIDLGTSAVKLLLAAPDGSCICVKSTYETADVRGWCDALKNAVAKLKTQASLTDLRAIGLSSQVGTYLTDTGEVIGWESSGGQAQLQRIKAAVTDAQWAAQIGMVHPDLISYPLPRLMYIKEHFPHCKAVLMPKEMLLQELTGNALTDVFSWRGLCHPDRQAYAQALLEQFDIQIALPRLGQPTDCVGTVTRAAADQYGLPENTPVYIGCNDFFAGLLGMGVLREGTVFELSGTSEHLGAITSERMDGAFVSGRYFNGFATYGGTKSSGASCDFAIREFGAAGLDADAVYPNAPIFLPYLKGERAPVYDENASGVYFGITEKTTSKELAYSALEGVVFSLYHIGEALQLPKAEAMITGGGSAGNALMAKLKAALFDCRILQATQKDASALGAAMLAMVGAGAFASVQEAAQAVVTYETMAEPDRQLRSQLLKRYAIYKELYVKLKKTFAKFDSLITAEEKI